MADHLNLALDATPEEIRETERVLKDALKRLEAVKACEHSTTEEERLASYLHFLQCKKERGSGIGRCSWHSERYEAQQPEDAWQAAYGEHRQYLAKAETLLEKGDLNAVLLFTDLLLLSEN